MKTNRTPDNGFFGPLAPAAIIAGVVNRRKRKKAEAQAAAQTQATNQAIADLQGQVSALANFQSPQAGTGQQDESGNALVIVLVVVLVLALGFGGFMWYKAQKP